MLGWLLVSCSTYNLESDAPGSEPLLCIDARQVQGGGELNDHHQVLDSVSTLRNKVSSLDLKSQPNLLRIDNCFFNPYPNHNRRITHTKMSYQKTPTITKL